MAIDLSAPIKPPTCKSGIYCIRHKESGATYIGSSVNLKQRIQGHRYALRRGRHCSAKLQAAWDTHREDAFEFCIIEPVDNPDKLTEREQYWLNELQASSQNSFNVRSKIEARHARVDGKISISQIRAARVLLKWEQEDLAKAAGVSKSSVQRTEAGSDPRVSTMARIQQALEAAGVIFIDPDAVGGEGVRLARRAGR